VFGKIRCAPEILQSLLNKPREDQPILGISLGPGNLLCMFPEAVLNMRYACLARVTHRGRVLNTIWKQATIFCLTQRKDQKTMTSHRDYTYHEPRSRL